MTTLVRRSGALLAILALSVAGGAQAEDAELSALRQQVAEQDARIRQLEARLEQSSRNLAAPGTVPADAAPRSTVADPAGPTGSAAPTGSGPDAAGNATAGLAPAPSSTATAGATAAVSGKAAVAAATPISAPPGVVRASSAGLFFQSDDGANVVRIRGNLGVEGRWYSDNSTPVTQDSWLFRRARPYIEGTLDNRYDFRLMPDFAGGKAIMVDAFLTARFATWLNVQAGKFKGPVGLERLQPDQFNRFIELGLPASLVPNRDLGAEVGGDFLGGAVGYVIGFLDGVTDGNSTDANPTPDTSSTGKKDFEGRLFLQPWARSGDAYRANLGFGIGGTYLNATGSASNTLLAGYRTPGQQTFFTYRSGNSATYLNGERKRLAPQFYYYVGSVGVLGEYVAATENVTRQVSAASRRSGQLDNSAWQLSLSYFLTGEDESYNSFVPRSTFEVGGPGWGAWELVARYHELRIDPAAFAGGSASFADPTVAPRRARAVGVGVNWWLNPNVKWMLDYNRTRFDGGALHGNRPDEGALLAEFNLTF